MNLKKLLNLGFLLVVLTAFAFTTNAQVRYLNSTDGDDSYTGVNATNDPAGSGPMRTLEGAFSKFASGTTVNMAAGNYTHDQSGIGGGDDSDGYTFGFVAPATGKSMTFIIQTYNLNNTVLLNGNGNFDVNTGTGTITFQPETAGTNLLTVNPTAGQGILLQSGTLDVSAFGADFTAGGNLNTITVTEGSLSGAPTYSDKTIVLTYDGANNKTAAGEVPGTLEALVLSLTANKTITFNSAMTFNTSATAAGVWGGISNTTANGDLVVNGLVTLKANGAIVPTAIETPKIINSQVGSDFTFAGGVTVSTRLVANAIPIGNMNTGTLKVTGELKFEQQNTAGVDDAAHASLVLNNSTGTLNLTGGVVEVVAPKKTGIYGVARTPLVAFNNNATGIANVGGGTSTTFTSTFTTAAAAGTVNVVGPVKVVGVLNNGAGHLIKLTTNTLTLSGSVNHTFTGNVSSSGVGMGLLDFTNTAAGPQNHGGAGQLPNIRTGKGAVTLTATTNINGNVAVAGAGDVILSATTNITGGLQVTAAGDIAFGAANTQVNENIDISGTGVVTSNVLTAQKDINLSAGGLTLGGNVAVFGNYLQTGGTLVFNANTFDIKANFTRNAGTVTPGNGTLQFSAGGSQVFSGGTNLQVYNFSVTAVGTGVTFQNGSVEVLNNATIVSNTNVILGNLNIRMIGNGAATPTFTNAGQYTSTGGGGVIFEGPAVGQHLISGNGVNSNIEIRLAAEAGTVDVLAGQTVTWSGVLRLTRGTIDILGTSTLNPSTTLTTPTLARNLGDANKNGTADGFPLAVNGTFNGTNQPYHLIYSGTNMNQDEAVGPEFVVGANPMVIDLTISANSTTRVGGAVASDVLLPTGSNYPISGSLSVSNSSVLELVGTANLISSGTDLAHAVNGSVTRTAGGTFQVTGTGTITGGTATADAASIADLTVSSSGIYNVNNLKVLGVAGADALTVTAGTANVAMQFYGAAPGDEGKILNLSVTGGSAVLTADANIVTAAAIGASGTLDFANQNLIMLVGSAFGTANNATLNATGADTKGYLVYEANATLNTGNVLVPRIMINNGITATLTGDSGFSDIFTDYSAAGPGTLVFGGNDFTSAGSTWNADGTYTGPGTVIVTGGTNLNLYDDITIPALTLNNDTKVFTLVDKDSGVPDLTVGGLFKSTKGAIEFNTSDVILTGAGAVFAYTAGTFTANSADGLGKNNSNGELLFNSAAAQTFAVGTTKFEVPNVRFQGAGGVTLSTTNPFKVTERLVFGNSAVGFGANDRMELSDGVWIEKIGNNHLDKVPMFGATHNIAYTTAASTIEDEMPSAGTILNDLYFNAGAKVTGSKALKVNGTLYVMSGDYDPTAAKMWALEMGDGTTVNRSGGVITDPAGGAGVFAISGGPITLTYSNTAAITTTGQEYPTAITVTTLNVNGNNVGDHLTLHASRSAGDFVLETGLGATPDINTVQFDLNAKSLSVATATLTRGVLISNAATSTLNVTGNIVATSNNSITNVNVNAATANLACAFGGGGRAVITGDAIFAGFGGNATVGGNITLNGAFAGNLTANGADAQALVTAGNQGITTLTLNMTGTNPTLNVSGGNITTGAAAGQGVVFQNGILNMTTGTQLVLPRPNLTAFGLGYDRTVVDADLTGTLVGHVVGNISRLANTGDGSGAGAGAINGRFIYPTGTLLGEYRPAAVTFTPDNPVINSTNIIVGHVDANPEGTVGLPTADGQVGDYSQFYWLFSASPVSITTTQKYDIELEAHNIRLPFESEEDLRIIRRQDGNADVNRWYMQSDENTYDNGLVVTGTDTLVQVRARLAMGGIVGSANRFTMGAPAQGPAFTAPTIVDYAMMAGNTLDVQFTAIAKTIGETITGYTVAGPAFATIDAATGLVKLAPGTDDISATAHVVTVTATTTSGATVDKSINVTVSAVPVPLAFTAVIGNTSTKSGNDYMFQYAANGGDGVTYTYALDSQAGDATTGTIAVDAAGKLTWTPLVADDGKQAIVTVSVVSNLETVTAVDTINVIGNSPPSFLLAGASVLPDTLIWVGETLDWTYIAIDPDNDALTYSFVGQFPSDAMLNPTTGAFSWAPKTALQFPVVITVQASDGTDSTNTQAIVTINEKTVTVTGTVSYNVSALAIVGATVNLMDGATLVGTATTDDSGAYTIADVSAGSYDVVVTKTNNWGGSLSSDALETQLSVTGDTTALSTDLQKLAANVVDVAGGIETDDALAILNASVGLKAFDVNDWMFEATTITVGTQNVSQDVSGICAGDARSDYNPMGLAKAANISVNSDEILNIKKESEFELPISIAELAEVGSFTFKLKYDVNKIEFLGVSSSNGGMLVSNVVEDVISIAWVNLDSKDVKVKDGSALVNLKFRATEMFSKSDEVSLELLDGAELTDKLAKNLSAGINIPVVAIGIPDVFALRQNYPNPFNPSTTIQYDLPENGKVTLTVYNSLGQRVGTLVNTKQVAGAYEVNFNASNLASGVYLYRVTVEGSKNFVMTKKMILMK